ncbi:alpha/beta fold hydrolase [Dermatophilus congolensis]|uniref:alpha/beta fold hydrolase n=1 Tax=Dermatophilus congolensis TaxID=1863 RepID=UPI001AAF1CFD|nr:alpha/beta hydrolase [Dermatophilus congolensis]MBO3129393.1 alpha/beta hydrolase [Dermatophilus congolensis]MBO3131974.1 alpha/beta hydrolase [Dermatophilus congolensis]MBO3133870.1 alpha/beta hydrolase [Dermatophilus congolensis]MBO3136100.1 alpha/beta hydrolase [Dermatophilus congolensis]MBO3138344.1 alpha/beta hydrolase [Dermatophilus congolensis]
MTGAPRRPLRRISNALRNRNRVVPISLRVIGNGPTVLLATGLGLAAHTFNDLTKQLTKDHTVITFDRPGLGHLSDMPRHDPPTLNDEINRVVTALEMAERRGAPLPATLVGHSWAGFIVEAVARARPDLVAGVVILDGSIEPDLPVPARRRRMLLRLGRFLIRYSVPHSPLRRFGAACIEDAAYLDLAVELHRLRDEQPLPAIPVRLLVAVWHRFLPHNRTWIKQQRDLAQALNTENPHRNLVIVQVVQWAGHHLAGWAPTTVAEAIRDVENTTNTEK